MAALAPSVFAVPRPSFRQAPWPRAYAAGATPASSSSASASQTTNGAPIESDGMRDLEACSHTGLRVAFGAVAAATSAAIVLRRPTRRRRQRLRAVALCAVAEVEAETEAATADSTSSGSGRRSSKGTKIIKAIGRNIEPVKAVQVTESDLERLRSEGPGAGQSLGRIQSGAKRDWIVKKADELGLVLKESKRGELTIFVPGEELLFGVVPFTFDELGLHDDIVMALLNWKPEAIEQATHIQAQSIPKILAGNDLVIQSETGAGKTFCYLLPAAHEAILRAEAVTGTSSSSRALPAGEDDEEEEEFEMEEASWMDADSAMCYRVEAPAGMAGLRPLKRPEEYAPRTGAILRVGDEFMCRDTYGSPLETQYLLTADQNGWVAWDRQDMRLRFAITSTEYTVGQRISALKRLKYGSGDVVERGGEGVIERVLPMVGVRWDDCPGVKAVDRPRATLRKVKDRSRGSRWARCAPDTLILTSTRELCEQVADTARKLGRLLPEEVQNEWTVAVAVGAPPGVGKKLKRGNEQWPFPTGDGAPKVLVTTLEFVGYFFHRKHLPLWANIRYVVYDEVDKLIAGPERWFLKRVQTMFLRAQRTEGAQVQSVAVAATMPSQGTKSTRLKIGNWMPAALRALPRPDLLHRQHPMVLQNWQYVPEDFETKVKILVEYMQASVGCKQKTRVKRKIKTCTQKVMEKTLIFCNDGKTATRLAESLATDHGFRSLGLFSSKIGNDERRKRLQVFRDGKIMLMVSTDLLSRGIDIPDLAHIIQFDFARNVVDHLHRIGRCSRAGSRGISMNFYDDSEQGGRKLAEAIQDVGSQPLDGLFSRNRGFAKGLKRTEAFKEMLLTQGLPVPPHLAGPEDLEDERPTPLLTDMLSDIDATEDGDVGEDPQDVDFNEESDDFDGKTDWEKDEEYADNVEALTAENRDDLEDEDSEDDEISRTFASTKYIECEEDDEECIVRQSTFRIPRDKAAAPVNTVLSTDSEGRDRVDAAAAPKTAAPATKATEAADEVKRSEEKWAQMQRSYNRHVRRPGGWSK